LAHFGIWAGPPDTAEAQSANQRFLDVKAKSLGQPSQLTSTTVRARRRSPITSPTSTRRAASPWPIPGQPNPRRPRHRRKFVGVAEAIVLVARALHDLESPVDRAGHHEANRLLASNWNPQTELGCGVDSIRSGLLFLCAPSGPVHHPALAASAQKQEGDCMSGGVPAGDYRDQGGTTRGESGRTSRVPGALGLVGPGALHRIAKRATPPGRGPAARGG